MKKTLIAAIVISILQAFSSTIFAEIKTPRIFADNMILQREKPVKIWGTAEPNAEVETEFAGRKKSARAAADGTWSVVFEPLAASKTPREMKFFENGKLSKSVKNVLVGELWICGGQSNMGVKLKDSTDFAAAEKRAKNLSNLRFFKQNPSVLARTPQKDSPEDSIWQCADFCDIKMWSAVAFYFGEKLSENLDVPVGLVYAALGGSSMIAWIPAEACEKNPYTKKTWDAFKKRVDAYDESAYQKAVVEHRELVSKVAAENKIRKAQGKPLVKIFWNKLTPPNRVSPEIAPYTPVLNFNAKVAPLAGLSARGVIWYQGEADASGETLEQFAPQLKLVVSEWRKIFENPQMPFIMAQISSFETINNWPPVRAAQSEVADTVAGVYIIPTIDVGERKNIHPRDKTTVGRRMAAMAESQVYGNKSLQPFAPTFKSAAFERDKVEVSFNTYSQTLKLVGEPRGFEVLSNGKWTPAKVSFADGKIVAASPDGAPVGGVRYLWSNCPLDDICIFGENSLPLLPFSFKK